MYPGSEGWDGGMTFNPMYENGVVPMKLLTTKENKCGFRVKCAIFGIFMKEILLYEVYETHKVLLQRNY